MGLLRRKPASSVRRSSRHTSEAVRTSAEKPRKQKPAARLPARQREPPSASTLTSLIPAIQRFVHHLRQGTLIRQDRFACLRWQRRDMPSLARTATVQKAKCSISLCSVLCILLMLRCAPVLRDALIPEAAARHSRRQTLPSTQTRTQKAHNAPISSTLTSVEPSARLAAPSDRTEESLPSLARTAPSQHTA